MSIVRLVIAILLALVSAYPTFQASLPNGVSIPIKEPIPVVANVSVGDVVTARGNVTLKKDGLDYDLYEGVYVSQLNTNQSMYAYGNFSNQTVAFMGGSLANPICNVSWTADGAQSVAGDGSALGSVSNCVTGTQLVQEIH